MGRIVTLNDITHLKEHEAVIAHQYAFQKILADSARDFIAIDNNSVDEAINNTLQRIGEYFSADLCDVFLLSPDQLSVSNTHEWHRAGVPRRVSLQHYSVDQTPWLRVQILDLATSVRIPDVEQMPPEANAEQALFRSHGVKAAVLTPLLNQEKVIGFMGVELEHTYEWRDEELNGLAIIAKIMGDSLGRLEYVKELVALKWQSDIAREAADKANQAKSEFLSSMNHELRTPMNAILGFGQILEYDSSLTQEQQDSVHEILKAGHHLLELISEVLDLSRVESGQLDLSLELVEVGSVVEECVRLIQPQAHKREIRIQHSEQEQAWVCADRTRLKQVLLNLLSNAVKYNREGGQIKLSLAHEQGRLRILVSDTGQGIPSDKLAELFQPFNRLGAEGSHIEGTGIGLTISRRLMELMGGSVDVQSEVGVVSTFWLELPLESRGEKAANEH